MHMDRFEYIGKTILQTNTLVNVFMYLQLIYSLEERVIIARCVGNSLKMEETFQKFIQTTINNCAELEFKSKS